MNEDTTVVVHCYQGDRATVETLLPWFTHHERPVLLLSPSDAPVMIAHPQVTCLSSGKAGWKGQHTLARQRAHWKLALRQPGSWFLLNDADSLCLSAEIPEYLYSDPSKFWCNVLCHEEEHREDDHPNLNPPYFMHRDALTAISDAAEELEIPEEANLEPHDWGQAIDGFYSHLVMNVLKLPYEDFPDGSTTWPRGINDMVRRAREGAVMFHGVKNSTHLNMVMFGRTQWLSAQERHAQEQQLATPDGPMYEGDTIRL